MGNANAGKHGAGRGRPEDARELPQEEPGIEAATAQDARERLDDGDSIIDPHGDSDDDDTTDIESGTSRGTGPSNG